MPFQVAIKVLHNADRSPKLYLMNPETSPSLFANGFLACAIKTCFHLDRTFNVHTTKVYNLITLCYALREHSTQPKSHTHHDC
jgi:hypothetical protein